MSSPSPRPLPLVLKIGGSGLIVFHLLALFALALAASSGPWPTPFGSSPAEPPAFVSSINKFLAPNYLRPLYMTHNYHFLSNIPEVPSVRFEVNLKDKNGQVTTYKFPDPEANFWVRHRHRLLAQALGDDSPVQSPQGQLVLPKGQKARTYTVWKATEGSPTFRLETVSELELTGANRNLMRPSEWSLLLARSYVRYLCRKYDAESGELLRRHRNAILPTVLFFPGELPPDTFEEQVSNFGEYRP